jgi:hypothetical protein
LLRSRLKIPRGIPRLWWAVRTTWLRGDELERRMQILAEMLPS